jgi:transposase
VLSTCLVADKAYDSDAFRAALAEQNCVPVIPSNGSRAQRLPYDKERYKARSEIECTFSLLKQARRFESSLREDAAQLRGRRRDRLRSAVAQNLDAAALFGPGSRVLEAHRELDEHRYDADDHRFARSVLGFSDEPQSRADVE